MELLLFFACVLIATAFAGADALGVLVVLAGCMLAASIVWCIVAPHLKHGCRSGG